LSALIAGMKSKPQVKKKILKLKIEEPVHFRLIGISSHENDYRLVWAINDKLKLQFTRIENLVIHRTKTGEDLEFSRYLFNDEDRYLKLFLISNHCPDRILFPEIKNFDFLLQIVGEINEAEVKEMVKKMKTVPVVSAVYILQPEKIKGIGNILNGV
jgi:hypothetical protein